MAEKSDKIILTGNKTTLKSLISETLAIRQLIENRDVGDIVAAPIDEWIRAYPLTTKLTIHYYSKKQPPYTADKGKKLVWAVYNIPDINRAKISWDLIKSVAGGSGGYLWGRFRAKADFDNGRQMHVYGGSSEAATKRLQQLASLSTAKILTLSVAEEKKEGRRLEDPRFYKESTQVYPAYFSIISAEKIIAESNLEAPSSNRATLTGNFKRSKTRKIPLWIDAAPSNVAQIIAESLRNRGVNIK